MNDDLNTKQIKFSWTRLLILVASVLLLAVIICGFIYWKLDQEVKSKNEQINSLNSQINTTLEKIRDLNSN